MADYGIMKAIYEALKSNEFLASKGLSDSIFFNASTQKDEMILLELEEIWTHIPLGKNDSLAKVKFKASTHMDPHSGREAVKVADELRQVMDGKTIALEKGMKATLKLAGSVIDLPIPQKANCVQQYFEALVRT
jgi:hypothetical protein